MMKYTLVFVALVAFFATTASVNAAVVTASFGNGERVFTTTSYLSRGDDSSYFNALSVDMSNFDYNITNVIDMNDPSVNTTFHAEYTDSFGNGRLFVTFNSPYNNFTHTRNF